MTEAEFAAALVNLVNEADRYEDDKAFNDVALDLMEGLLKRRTDDKRAARAEHLRGRASVWPS